MSMTLIKEIGRAKIDVDISSDLITSSLDLLFQDDLKTKSE